MLLTVMDGESSYAGKLDDDAKCKGLRDLLYPYFVFVCATTGLLFTVQLPATVFISVSCWSSQGPPSLLAPLAMWRLLRINARKWKRATSSVPSFYTVRNITPIGVYKF